MNSKQTSVLKKTRSGTRRLSKAQRRLTFFFLFPKYSKTLGTQFPRFCLPKLGQILGSLSLHGKKKPLQVCDDSAVTNRLEICLLGERPHTSASTDQNHSGHPWKGPLQEPASEEECFVLNKEVPLKPSFPFMILSQCRYNSLFLLGSSHVNLVSSRFLTVAQGIGIF